MEAVWEDSSQGQRPRKARNDSRQVPASRSQRLVE